jgi:hypothetical protein
MLVGVGACGPNVASNGDESSEGPTGPDPDATDPDATDPDASGSVSIDGSGGNDDGGGIQISDQHAVDVLFVVDNTGSMGENQARLAAGIGTLVDRLEAGGLDYRIGVTTTDNGNPLCGSTGPEAGKLVSSSCRARQGDFVFGGTPPVDATQVACFDQCAAEDLGITPTAIELDPQPTARPWIESTGGVANLASLTTTEALRCMLPQGVAGCGFEQPLESMYKSLLRAEKDDEAQYGFVRSSAVLAIVIVSDETDCSYSSDWESIFLPAEQGGNPDVFWSDPTAPSPSSAVCWNAGVACTGGPSVYDECHAENMGVDGSPGVDESEAVLQSVSRYTEIVQQIEDVKRELAPSQEVLVAAITGVPVGYESDQAELVYQESPDTAFADEFGIGQGCVRNEDGGFGIPPVREREFAEAFEVGDQRNLYSICASDFAPALDAIGASIRDQIRPACFPACVADTNPITVDVVDPSCSVTQGGVDVQECEGGAVPDGVDVCYEPVTGAGLSAICAEEGWNLELRFVRSEGAAANATFEVECQLSVQKEIDCPDL